MLRGILYFRRSIAYRVDILTSLSVLYYKSVSFAFGLIYSLSVVCATFQTDEGRRRIWIWIPDTCTQLLDRAWQLKLSI